MGNIQLQKDILHLTDAFRLLINRSQQMLTVNRFDKVKQSNSLTRLIRLQMSDKVPVAVFAQGLLLMLGLLHAVFAYVGNAQGFDICNNFWRMIFRHRHQRYIISCEQVFIFTLVQSRRYLLLNLL